MSTKSKQRHKKTIVFNIIQCHKSQFSRDIKTDQLNSKIQSQCRLIHALNAVYEVSSLCFETQPLSLARRLMHDDAVTISYQLMKSYDDSFFLLQFSAQFHPWQRVGKTKAMRFDDKQHANSNSGFKLVLARLNQQSDKSFIRLSLVVM